MRLATLLLALALLPIAPASAQTSPDVRYDYDVEDPADDVMLVASNGSERWSAKPAVDVRRYRSAVEGDFLVQTITFGAAPPAEALRVEMTLTIAPSGQQPLPISLWFTDGKAATATTSNAGAEGTVTSDGFVVRLPLAKLEGARCFAPRIDVIYAPDDDPVTSTDAGLQGWQDGFALRAHRCVMTAGSAPVLPVEDGLDGACPPASVPEGVKVDATWTDARDDVAAGGAKVGMPDADIVEVSSKREGDEIVVRMTMAAFPAESHVPLATLEFLLEGKTEQYDSEGKDSIVLGFLHPEHDATGTRTVVDGEKGDRRTFYARGAREGDDFVARFCASLIPDDAQCWAPRATVTYNEGDRPTDKLQFAWDEGPCAGKSGSSDAVAADAGDEPGAEAASEDKAESPGFAPLALLLAAGVALALTRRRA